MPMSPTRLRTAAVLHLAVLLCCNLHSVFAKNVTVMDTDPSIVYSPLESWYPSSNLCSTCLDPGVSTSYHEGIHLASGHDLDDTASTRSSGVPTPSSPLPVQASSSLHFAVTAGSPTIFFSTPSPTMTSDGGRGLSSDSSGKSPLTMSPSPPSPPTILPRLDSDDPGFTDSPVTLSFNFTGSAIYIFYIQPPSSATMGGTPTNMNLSFILDNQPPGTFLSTETGIMGFQPNVFSLGGLSDGPHQLVVNVGDDSVFIFDRFIYTDNSVGDSTSTTGSPTATAVKARIKKNNNVATFGGALGGSVGVLSLFSLGIALSIIRRRMLAARRDRLDNEANATGDTPSMSGPVPFTPRYFPDTIIPADPPTYNDALSSSGYTSRQRSYADIPPASPPPPLEEMPPPPPFPVALSAPIPAFPPGIILPSIPVANQTSHSPDLADNGSSNITSPPENAPLLQSPDSDMRPHSRPPTISDHVSHENPETNDHRPEDAS